MRKLLSWLLICSIIFTFSGCKKEEEKKDKVNGFEIKAATNVVDSYMKSLAKEDYEGCRKLYTQELDRKTAVMPISKLKINGYQVTEINEIGRTGAFKIRVTRAAIDEALSSLDEYDIRVVKDGAEYKINEIANNTQKEVFIERDGIRYRDENNVKTNLVIDQSGIPQYAFSKNDQANVYKMLVPKKQFGVVNFNYEGDKLAVTTYDENSYVAIVNIDESLAVQGEGTGEGGAAANGADGNTVVIPKEKPIGKEIISLDLVEGTKVQFMTFSGDQKFLVVQYEKSKVGRYIGVYKTDNGEMIPVNFQKNFPMDKVEILFSSYDKGVMNFEVIAKETINSAEVSALGKWQLNLDDFTIKKL